MRMLIIGASGFVGSYLFNTAKKFKHEVKGTYFGRKIPGSIFIDITNARGVERVIKSVGPDVVFLPAGIPFVDWCEKHPKESWEVNVGGVKNVVEVMKKLGGVLVYYSSEYVFGEKSGPYRESDMPKPLNVYGKQKLESEKLVLAIGGLCLRTVLVYGNETTTKNYAEQIIRSLSEDKKFYAAVDQISTPTYVVDLVDASLQLVQKKIKGIVHVAGPEKMSRYELANKIAEAFELDKSLIEAVNTRELRQIARRPMKAGLNSDKLQNILHKRLSSVDVGLKQMKKTRKI